MLQHKGTQRLETTRLILRKFTMDDARAMYENWASDPEVTKYLMWPTHTSTDVTKMVLEDWVNSYEIFHRVTTCMPSRGLATR